MRGGAPASPGPPPRPRFKVEGRGVPGEPDSSGLGWGGASKHFCGGGVECRQLRWEDGWPPPRQGGQQEQQREQQWEQQQPPTVVLGADLLYDPTAIPALLALLKQVLAAAGTSADTCASLSAEAGEEGEAAAAVFAPAAYLATTLRNEATLLCFVEAAEADPAICIRQLDDVLDPEATAAACGGGGSDAAPAPEIRFQHHPTLEAARDRILLHRITLAVPL